MIEELPLDEILDLSVHDVLQALHSWLRDLAGVKLRKTMWGSPAGKKRLAKRLAALLPPHDTYVEPFAGSGAVLFEKEPAEVEAINDADPEIAAAYRTIKALTEDDLERLRRMDWTGSRSTFERLVASKPTGSLQKLHRFLYLSHFSYGNLRGKSFNPNSEGVEATTVSRIEADRPRLKNVRIFSGSYEKVVREYDGPKTVFFLDPPYSGYDVDVGEGRFDEARFFEVLLSLKGRFLLTYGIRGELPKLLRAEKGFRVKSIRPKRSIRSMRGVGGGKVLTTLLVANYDLVEKELAILDQEDWEVVSDSALSPADPALALSGRDEEPDMSEGENTFAKRCALIKGADPSDERFVLGIVLEPEVVDAHNEIYSAEEIRRAAHRFMEEFGGQLGIMHREAADGRIRILESYIALADFTVGDVVVRKGTWLLGVRIVDDELWEQVKAGEFDGFSIGGSARWMPEESPDQPPEQAG